MTEIKEVLKKDIPDFLDNTDFWNQSFLAISKHRLYAHYKNPNCHPDDVVLLLGYLDDELVGYMGIFMDKIILDGSEHKIGWLSTWWVHPKTKGTGIGRKIMNTMYEINEGRIGISQFTESAKRVYDKSGYFVTLKENIGVKAVLRSNLSFVIPIVVKGINSGNKIIHFCDRFLDVFNNIKLKAHQYFIKSTLKKLRLEYLTKIDAETLELIRKHNANHISPKTPEFYEWLKAYNWVEEAPLLGYTAKERYAFSMVDTSFSIYLVKIFWDQRLIGFIVLQKRDRTMKVLFAYYEESDVNHNTARIISNTIKLHCIQQNIREVICYDPGICKELKVSNIFIYKRKKIKQSIISKVYNKEDYSDVWMNFGDGDCAFA